jgi:hypothetical protein
VEDEIDEIIPTIFSEMESDGENQSSQLFAYYHACNSAERAVVDNIMMYLCGWTFPTILKKCGIDFDEKGTGSWDMRSRE